MIKTWPLTLSLLLAVFKTFDYYGQDTIPLRRDIFDFEVGDGFSYKRFWEGPPDKWWKEILSKTYNEDSTVVTYQIQYSYYYLEFYYPYTPHSGSYLATDVYDNLNVPVIDVEQYADNDTSALIIETFCQTPEYWMYYFTDEFEFMMDITKYGLHIGETYYINNDPMGYYSEGLLGYHNSLETCNWSSPINRVDEMLQANFKIYPCPASDRIFFNNDFEWFETLECFNMNGEMVLSTSLNCEHQCALDIDLSDGVYNVILRNDAQHRFYSTRLIISNH